MKPRLTNRLVIALSVVLTTLMGCEKKEEERGYTINGTLNYENDVDSIYIYEYTSGNPTNSKKLNSAAVVDNKFTIKGTIDPPQIVIFGNIQKNFGGELILENATYTISSDGTNLTVKGGKMHEKVLGFSSTPEYQKIVQEYNTSSDALFKDLDMQDEEAVNAAREKADKLGDKILQYEDDVFDNIINDKKESTLVKLFALVSTQNWKTYTKKKKVALLDEYEKELGEHINIKTLRELIAKDDQTLEMAASVKNGSMFKELVAKDVDGNPISLADLVKKNKYTLLEFWASWCSPCRAEIPNLKKAYKKYKDLGLEIYSVSIDRDRKAWEKALKKEQTTWKNSIIVGDEKKQVDAYGVQGVPSSYLISEDGTIVASNNELREFDLDRTLSKLFENTQTK